MQRRNAQLQRRITAYHEAAHAVLAFRFGIPVDEVALCSTGPLAGYVSLSGDSSMSAESLRKCTSELKWAILVRAAEQRAMVSLAGAVAEAKLLGTPMRSHYSESDLQTCLRLCYALCHYRDHLVKTNNMSLSKIDPAEMAERLRRRTQRILGHPKTWRAVTTLAHDLEGWGMLTGNDSADTVQWAARTRNQLALSLPMPRSRNRNRLSEQNESRERKRAVSTPAENCTL